MNRLTAKRERFCQEMIKPKANQSRAYRAAFNAHGMKAKTIHEKASRLMAEGKIRARIAELMKPAIEQVRMTREEWLLKFEKMVRGDVRKMFDEFGHPIEISKLGDHEAAMVEGFQLTAEYTKVKKSDGSTEPVPTGYTKTYKLTPKIKVLLELGKAMGWCVDTKDVRLGATLEELVLGSMELENPSL